MAIAFRSQGAAVAGTTSITTAAYGTGWVDGDLAVCEIASNHATVETTQPTVSGFTLIGTLNGGGGTQGAGTGNRRLSYFTRTCVTGDTSPTISLSTGNSMIAAITIIQKDAGQAWETSVSAFGAETTAGTSWSEVMTTDPGFIADDIALIACAVRDDNNQSSAEGFSATGATFGTFTERIDLDSALGNDISLHVATGTCTAGPSSAAGTRTATHSLSETGVMGVLRVRAVDNSQEGGADATVPTAAAGSGTPAEAVSGGSDTTVPTAAAGGGTFGLESGSDATVEVSVTGDGIMTLTGGSTATVEVSVAGAGTATEEGSSGSTATVPTAAAGAGTPAEAVSAGSATIVEVSATGGGTFGLESGSTATVEVSVVGAGTAAEQASSGSTATVEVAAVGAGTVESGSTATVEVSAIGAGTPAENPSSGADATVEVTAVGAGTVESGSTATVEVSVTGGGSSQESGGGESGGSTATVETSVTGTGTATESASGGTTATVPVDVTGAGTATENGSGGSNTTVLVTNIGQQLSGGGSTTIQVTVTGGGLQTFDATEVLGRGLSSARLYDDSIGTARLLKPVANATLRNSVATAHLRKD